MLNITVMRVSLLLMSFLILENSNNNEKYKEKSLIELKSCYFYEVFNSNNPLFIFKGVESLFIRNSMLEGVISSNIYSFEPINNNLL